MATTTHTTERDRGVARGVAAAVKDGHLTLALPDTDYRIDLLTKGAIDAAPGRRTEGTITAQARRIDVIKSGGRYFEPVIGRPRRVQGRIVAIDESANTITVLAAAPIVCRVGPGQSAGKFMVDQQVSFDVEPGAVFTPTV